MAQQPVVLQLPEELYERIRQVAQDSNRPLETVMVDSLSLLFGDLPDNAELTPQILATFSDEQLWAIVQRSLAWPQDVRLRELTTLGKQGSLSAEEQSELERLVDQVDRYVLVRSHALLLLKQRGYDVERRLKLGA
jgi:hypothetical protein